ncbi:hypothetical protein EJ02DRAFT_337201 [Clathrospora elynae]|uniref:F-box domain-containing protein n=1 Tax=Clathrospora elynae TaxID=706981 RepID=A0A6A5T012_9PLEO|nr:hypothetical protein EJ02DRAFT_337201 [Clathrospora elynae]
MFITSSLVASRFASKKYEVNALYNPLYDLPYELVHHVASYLDQTDGTCLALSGIRLWKTLAPNIARPADEEPTGVWKRLSRDIYYKNRSSGWIDGRQQIWCTSCACLHCRTAFPKDTISLPRWELKCFADRSLSYLRPFFRTHSQYHPLSGPKFMTPPSLYIEPCTSEVVLKARIRLFSSRHEDDVRVADIREALTGIDDAICPHMTTSDPGLIDCLLHGRTRIFLSASVSIRVSVQCNFCQTKLSVKRRVTADEVVLDIKRRLGHVERETDPIWRAQLEPKGV